MFKSYPQEMLVLVESLLDEETAKKQSPIWWQNTSPWKDLYKPLSAYVSDHVSKHLIAVRQGLKDLIDPAAVMDVPVKTKEVTAMISAACVVGTQPGLRLVLELASVLPQGAVFAEGSLDCKSIQQGRCATGLDFVLGKAPPGL